MTIPNVFPIDLNFQGIAGSIAVYLIPHASGAALVECGSGSTLDSLEAGLKIHGYTTNDVTDVFLTHIHLDHAGACGYLAQRGASIHVHPNGASHLLNPEKLLASAHRIYGEMMKPLWGDFLPVQEDRLSIVSDNDEIEVGGLRIRALETPGHASHHLVYILDEICFSGDIGGVRLHGSQHISLPMPPPEFNLELWRQSLIRLKELSFSHIAPTHFGIYPDARWHLQMLDQALDEVETWIESTLSENPSIDTLRQAIAEWENQRLIRDGVDRANLNAHQAANPTFMSADGIQRYWNKYRINHS